MDHGAAVLMPLAAFGLIAMVVVASVIYRLGAGKPIYPKLPSRALYAERWASGPFAYNCLLVSVTASSLSVVPKFPFNLMFLAEIYGLERSIPLASIHSVQQTGSNVAVLYGADQQTLRLRLSKPDQFLNTISTVLSPATA